MTSFQKKFVIFGFAGVAGLLSCSLGFLQMDSFADNSEEQVFGHAPAENKKNKKDQLAAKAETKKDAKTESSRTLPEFPAPNFKSEKPKDESKVLLNDPGMSKAWGHAKSDALKAWEVSQGNKDIVVAIIDTGAQLSHEDLEKNFWTNSGEIGKDSAGRDKSTNGIDDDNDG